ncbi:MAG: RNase adapter RapZ [Actinomycetota bacterium]|nr:RNase adapter RapZ [Actinomycetota bacterium]
MTARTTSEQAQRATRAKVRRSAPAAPTVAEGPASPDFAIITGLSGAGRSEAAKCLEDIGYFVVDNLPPALIGKMAELAAGSGGPARVAIVADARGGVFFHELSRGLEDLKKLSIPYRILFLEASDQDLLQRYAVTRHRHPLAPADRVVEGIRKERLMMESLKGEADLIVDTSGLTPHELRDRIRDAFAKAPPEQGLQVSVVSFGYKYGVPRDADIVLDVRFLPNPYWIPKYRPLPGTDSRVRKYVTEQESYGEFMKRLRSLLEFVVPGFVAEGKSYLTVAVGCTGGRHRSIVVADAVAEFFRDQGLPVSLEHRDLDHE